MCAKLLIFGFSLSLNWIALFKAPVISGDDSLAVPTAQSPFEVPFSWRVSAILTLVVSYGIIIRSSVCLRPNPWWSALLGIADISSS